MKTQNSKFKFFVLALVSLAILVATNIITYQVAGQKFKASSVTDEPSTIIKYEPRSEQIDPELAIIFEALDVIGNYYFEPVDKAHLVEGAVIGMVESLEDPQVMFYDAAGLEEFINETQGSYSGIGIRIIEAYQNIVVFETFPDSPAERSGLSPGDRLLEVDGVELTGQGLNRAVELLRGPGGSKVALLVNRPGADEPLKLSVNREEINITTVFGEMLEEGLGYIRIDSFDGGTFNEFSARFNQLEQAGIKKGLIIDLRNNPGGLVDQAVEIAKLIVPEGEIVKLVGREGEVKTIYYSSADPRPYPMVVLINEDSASSAELLAGALQDRQAALLVGQTTYGKASVQQLAQLSGDNAILVTMARYFTPSGRDIHKQGIEPDFEVEMPETLRYYRYFFPGRLAEEDYGLDVEMLQLMLEQLGYKVKVSGFFDTQTLIALTSFQAEAGLQASGVFDDQTWVFLREALDEAATESDTQLNFALELFDKPDLFSSLGGDL